MMVVGSDGRFLKAIRLLPNLKIWKISEGKKIADVSQNEDNGETTFKQKL